MLNKQNIISAQAHFGARGFFETYHGDNLGRDFFINKIWTNL